MAASLFGSCGAKTTAITLSPGAEILFYVTEESTFFGVVTVNTTARHYGVKVFAQCGMEPGIVGTSVHVRIARNESEMTVGRAKGDLISVAACEQVHDVDELGFVGEEEKENLRKILDVSRSLFGEGGELAVPVQHLPKVGVYGSNPTP